MESINVLAQCIYLTELDGSINFTFTLKILWVWNFTVFFRHQDGNAQRYCKQFGEWVLSRPTELQRIPLCH